MLPSLSQQCKGREAPSGVVKHSRATKATPKVSPGPHTGTAGHRPPPPVPSGSRSVALWARPSKNPSGPAWALHSSATSGSPSLWGQPVPALPAALAGQKGPRGKKITPHLVPHNRPGPSAPHLGRTRGNFQLFQRCRSGACARLFLQHGLHSVGSVAIAQAIVLLYKE